MPLERVCACKVLPRIFAEYDLQGLNLRRAAVALKVLPSLEAIAVAPAALDLSDSPKCVVVLHGCEQSLVMYMIKVTNGEKRWERHIFEGRSASRHSQRERPAVEMRASMRGVMVQAINERLAGPHISSTEATPCPLLAGVIDKGSKDPWEVLGSANGPASRGNQRSGEL